MGSRMISRPTPVDHRLLMPGLRITVGELVAVFIDHRPGQMPTCGACRHRYTATAPLCPSRVLAAGLLRRRQREDRKAVVGIEAELRHHRDDRALPNPEPEPAPFDTPALFPVEAW